MSETIIRIDHVSKEYRLGAIGGGTLKGDLQSAWARMRGKEDPNGKIGQTTYHNNDRFLALDDVSFEVKKGEALGIIGHNGAGKSTLLKLLSRVTAPTKGTISYNGRIASMLEVGTGFHPELTGRENVYLNGAILGMTRAEIDRKFDQIVDFAEMEQFIDTPVKRYSSGMYVKLAFAVAAHLDSEIMVMDEVLAVGDMKFQQKCLGKMGDAANQEGRTVLYVSHNMNTIRQLCTRCIVLDHGKVVFDGDVEEAIDIYSHRSDVANNTYIYSESVHSYKSNPSFSINSLCILSQDDNRMNCDGLYHIMLECCSKLNRKDVFFRFEIQDATGQKIGTALSRNAISFCQNKNTSVQICFDTSHLVPGIYDADIVAYQKNEYGTEEFLDGVYPGMTFEIVNCAMDDAQPTWLPGPWGHIHLHDLLILGGE